MERKKIGLLNDDFDLALALKISKVSYPWVIFLLTLGYCLAFLYNRYTQPVYQSKAIVKIGEANNMNKIMQFENIYDMPIAGEIELIRSKTLIKRALQKLPLDISYISEGSFLNFEEYKNSRYRVSYQVKDQAIFATPIYVKFIEDEKVQINYVINDILHEYTFPINSWTTLPEIEIKISISQSNYYKIQKEETTSPMYFSLNSQEDILNNCLAQMMINIVSEEAKTVEIEFTSNNPLKAADLANAISTEFLAYNVEKKSESANQMINFTNDQLLAISEKINDYSKTLEPYMTKDDNGQKFNPMLFDNVSQKEELLNDQYHLLNFELQALIDYKGKLSRLQGDDYIYAPLLTSPNTHSLLGVIQQYQMMITQRKELQYQYTSNSGPIKELDYKIQLNKRELIENVDIAISEMQDQLASLEKRRSSKKIENTAIENSTKIKTSEINQIERMFEISQDYYTKLLQKKSEFEMVKAGFVSNNDILEYAYSNDIPIEPQRRLVYVLFISIGALIGFGIIIVRYLLHNTVSTIIDIVKYTNQVAILGMIPEYKESIPISQLLVDKNPKSLMTEAFRSVRSNLQFLTKNEGSKILAVTSTVSGEGKTFVAINLGGIIAFSGKKSNHS